ncbi:YceI family protein [Segetibacter aerophilus]|uniref:Polyisoprenoid-binding protein n=1 Tax=Segetibacter aerophilus TaxID=670293 RepID=A0A512BCF5_9BACT|nr:YceI family protein [Segetibacter aerophilus]GEO09638.1 polyisoprenoid-binding protein [Segetibacter aerophilus]
MATYKIDVDHSDIMFKVKHLMISTVSGIFKKFDATLEVNEQDLSDAKVTFEADVDSVDTKNEQRDAHLKSDDFFNAEQFPKMTFKSTSIKKVGNDEYTLTGDFTIRDITKSIDLKVEYNGSTKDPWGQERMGFEVSGKINRKEYGLKWSAVTEAGGLVVADDVKLAMNVEMVKQA